MIELEPKYRTLIQEFLDAKIEHNLKLEIVKCIDDPNAKAALPISSMNHRLEKFFGAGDLNTVKPIKELELLRAIIYWIFNWAYTEDAAKWWDLSDELECNQEIPEKYKRKTELQTRKIIL